MRIKAQFRPSILAPQPIGTKQIVEGDFDDRTGILWVTCPPSAEAPAGRVGIHISSRVILVPEAEEQKTKPKSA